MNWICELNIWTEYLIYYIIEYPTTKPATTIEIILINFINIFKDGPDVSFKGSPTVSPTTPALWANEPLPPKSSHSSAEQGQ